MKFEADILFKDFQYLFCAELSEGYQYFQSWQEFIELFTHHLTTSTKPLYCMSAHLGPDNTLYVDASQYIVIPWNELEKYI